MKKFIVVTGLLGLAGLAAGALAYVLGREKIDDLLAGRPSTPTPTPPQPGPEKQTGAPKTSAVGKTGGVEKTQTVSQTKKSAQEEPVIASATGGGSSDRVVVSGKGTKFHRPGCSSAVGETREIIREEALAAGLTPCGRCKP